MRSSWEHKKGSGLTSAGPDGGWEVYRQTCKAGAARKAAYVANLLIEVHSALDCVSIPGEDVSVADADFWSVGIWEPADATDTGTIFADDELVKFARPLIKVIGQVQADVPLARDARYASFFEMAPYEVIDYHRDDEDKVITSLEGSSTIYLQHRHGRTTLLPFDIDPGDTYGLRANHPVSGKTPLHAVENGFAPRLTMMLS